ncbi:restriction endonuclease subunit S [Mycoplasmoides pneumoniae]
MQIRTYKIKDICDIQRGRGITKEYIKNNSGKYPVYSPATTNNGELGFINTYDFAGEYVTWTTNGYAGVVFYRNGKFSASQDCGVLKVRNKEINAQFLAFALSLKTPQFVHNLGSRPKLNRKVVAEISLDFPPLEVQEKIAHFLKSFNELSSQLKAELIKRQKQYAFYSDYLLNPKHSQGEEYKLFKLKDIAKKILVGGEKPSDFQKEKDQVYKYPILSNSRKADDFLGYSKTFRIAEKSITVSARGTIGAVFYRDFSYLPAVSLICFIPKPEFNIKFLFHALKATKFHKQGSGTGQLTMAQFKEYQVYIPSLKKQQEIAATLDPLYYIFANSNWGIYKEIELRKKQMQYYQERLFQWIENQKV